MFRGAVTMAIRDTLSLWLFLSLSYSSLMTVCSNAPFIDGGQCLLWWCHTTGGKVHRKGDLYNSRAESESPQGCVSVFQCLCVCAAGQRGWWVRTPLIREKTIICENTSFFICSAKSPSRNGSLRRLADAFRCVCVSVSIKNLLILMDQQDRSAVLKCETKQYPWEMG